MESLFYAATSLIMQLIQEMSEWISNVKNISQR